MLGAAQHAPRGVDASHMLPLTRAASARFTELEKTPSEYVKHGLEGVVAKGKAKEKEEAPTRSSTMSSTNPHKPTSTSVGPPPLDGGYWDDRCLVRFLQGVFARYVAYPDPDAVVEGADLDVGISEEEAAKEAKECFGDVLRWGTKIELDHHLVYHTRTCWVLGFSRESSCFADVFFADYELGRLLACQQDKAGAMAHFDIVTHGKATELNPMHKRGGKYSMEVRVPMFLDSFRGHALIHTSERPQYAYTCCDGGVGAGGASVNGASLLWCSIAFRATYFSSLALCHSLYTTMPILYSYVLCTNAHVVLPLTDNEVMLSDCRVSISLSFLIINNNCLYIDIRSPYSTERGRTFGAAFRVPDVPCDSITPPYGRMAPIDAGQLLTPATYPLLCQERMQHCWRLSFPSIEALRRTTWRPWARHRRLSPCLRDQLAQSCQSAATYHIVATTLLNPLKSMAAARCIA
jgi:hypothetical protein